MSWAWMPVKIERVTETADTIAIYRCPDCQDAWLAVNHPHNPSTMSSDEFWRTILLLVGFVCGLVVKGMWS